MTDPTVYDMIVRSLVDPVGVEGRRLIVPVEMAVTQEEVDAVCDALKDLPTPGERKYR